MSNEVFHQRFSTGRAKRVTGKGLKYDVMLTGVGGEGILSTGVVLARAANLEGKYVRGVQLHGLAQRGGTIPTFVRFGDVDSPGIMEGQADLVIAAEPLEAIRACYYANKNKTTFVVSNFQYTPIYANLTDTPYPSLKSIEKKIKPFAKELKFFPAHHEAKLRFGKHVYGNTVLLGAAAKYLPLKEKSLREAIKISVPRGVQENLNAFELGLKLKPI